jgi:hypothetical protein
MGTVRNPAHSAVDLRTGSRCPNSPAVPFSRTTELSPRAQDGTYGGGEKVRGKLVLRFCPCEVLDAYTGSSKVRS